MRHVQLSHALPFLMLFIQVFLGQSFFDFSSSETFSLPLPSFPLCPLVTWMELVIVGCFFFFLSGGKGYLFPARPVHIIKGIKGLNEIREWRTEWKVKWRGRRRWYRFYKGCISWDSINNNTVQCSEGDPAKVDEAPAWVQMTGSSSWLQPWAEAIQKHSLTSLISLLTFLALTNPTTSYWLCLLFKYIWSYEKGVHTWTVYGSLDDFLKIFISCVLLISTAVEPSKWLRSYKWTLRTNVWRFNERHLNTARVTVVFLTFVRLYWF